MWALIPGKDKRASIQVSSAPYCTVCELNCALLVIEMRFGVFFSSSRSFCSGSIVTSSRPPYGARPSRCGVTALKSTPRT